MRNMVRVIFHKGLLILISLTSRTAQEKQPATILALTPPVTSTSPAMYESAQADQTISTPVKSGYSTQVDSSLKFPVIKEESFVLHKSYNSFFLVNALTREIETLAANYLSAYSSTSGQLSLEPGGRYIEEVNDRTLWAIRK
jgi:hypothetical protein